MASRAALRLSINGRPDCVARRRIRMWLIYTLRNASAEFTGFEMKS